MPSAASEFEVPLVDIAPYIADPSSPTAQKVVEQVRNACMTSGFFSLVGHGIPETLQNAVFNGAKAFFALPFEEKDKLDKKLSLGASNRGYEVLGGQALEEGKLPDLKEVSLTWRIPQHPLSLFRDSTLVKTYQQMILEQLPAGFTWDLMSGHQRLSFRKPISKYL